MYIEILHPIHHNNKPYERGVFHVGNGVGEIPEHAATRFLEKLPDNAVALPDDDPKILKLEGRARPW